MSKTTKIIFSSIMAVIALTGLIMGILGLIGVLDMGLAIIGFIIMALGLVATVAPWADQILADLYAPSIEKMKEKSDRYCVECGRAIPFNANKCPYCGHIYNHPNQFDWE